MYIGGGIILIVVGGILAFGVKNQSVGNFDLSAIGWIMMGGGVLAIVISFILMQQRTNTSHTEIVERHDLGGPPARY
jgi:Domain of unknown function (DUF6458)